MQSRCLFRPHGAHRVVCGTLASRHLNGLERATLQNLLDDLLVILGVELGREQRLGSGVNLALSTLLVRDEDLEGRDEVRHGDALVALPLLVGLDVIDEDKEVIVLALVVDLGLSGLAASHLECLVWGLRMVVCDE
jgi:hypothetical protein